MLVLETLAWGPRPSKWIQEQVRESVELRQPVVELSLYHQSIQLFPEPSRHHRHQCLPNLPVFQGRQTVISLPDEFRSVASVPHL